MKKSRSNKIWMFVVSLCLILILTPSLLYARLKYTGVNLAGAEFGATVLPGTYGTNYIYPNAAEVDYYMRKGMNTFRLPFRWECLQHAQLSALDADELNRMDTFVKYATAKGAYVIIEPHNFQRYYPDPNNFQSSAQGLVGSAVPDAAFADFWSKLASHYKSNSRVIFNLMNEPNTMPTAQLVVSENAAIAAIRNAGAKNLILVPGNQWTGAWTWCASDNSTEMPKIVDPGANFAFEVHQYMDDDGSGGSEGISNNDPLLGVKRISDFTNWLRMHNFKGFLGEFAVANSRIGNADVGDEVIENLLKHLEANSDVWLGWTWWAGGPWWGNYQFTLEPTNLGQPDQGPDRAAMAVLQPHFICPFSLVPIHTLLL